MKNRRLQIIVMICAMIGATLNLVQGQSFYLNAVVYGGATVSPSDPGIAAYSDSAGDYNDPSGIGLDGLSRTYRVSGLSTYTADGITAVGSSSSMASASASLFDLQISGSISATYPATPPNTIGGDPVDPSHAGAYSVAGTQLGIDDLVISGSTSLVNISLNLIGSNIRNSTFSADFGNRLNDGPYSGETSGVFRSGSFSVPVGIPVSLTIGISRQVSILAEYGQQLTESFSGSVSLPRNGPIFNLPEGFTINSESAGIVNNRFTAVPEPSEYVGIAGIALAAFAIRHRRNR